MCDINICKVVGTESVRITVLYGTIHKSKRCSTCTSTTKEPLSLNGYMFSFFFF